MRGVRSPADSWLPGSDWGTETGAGGQAPQIPKLAMDGAFSMLVTPICCWFTMNVVYGTGVNEAFFESDSEKATNKQKTFIDQ